MASAFKTSRGAWRVTFKGLDGQAGLIHLGTSCNKKTAEQVRAAVEELLHAAQSNTAPDRLTSQWLAGVHDAIHAKLSAAGLTDPRATAPSRQLGNAFQAIIDRRKGDLSHSGLEKLKQAKARLVGYFGESKDLRRITVADARDFSRKMATDFATATASGHVRKIKAFFADCVDRGILDASPFAKIKGGSEHNAARMFYVSPAVIESVIDQTTNPQWRLLLAMARYAGVRIPSEIVFMKWTDIQWDKNRMLVRSQKTARMGKPTRMVPIFPALRPYLQAAFDAAEDGAVKVFTLPARTSSALRKPVIELIERAGYPVWEKLFQNLRASCETDLCQQFPLHVACAFIGNTAAVANKHYLQVTDAHFEQAAKGVAQGVLKHAETEGNTVPRKTQKPLENQGFRDTSMASAGPELTEDSLGNTADRPKGVAQRTLRTGTDEERLNAAMQRIHVQTQLMLSAARRKAGGR